MFRRERCFLSVVVVRVPCVRECRLEMLALSSIALDSHLSLSEGKSQHARDRANLSRGRGSFCVKGRARDRLSRPRMAEWVKQQAEREAEKEQKRLERLQRKLAEPRPCSANPAYQRQCHEMAERLEDSVLKGEKEARRPPHTEGGPRVPWVTEPRGPDGGRGVGVSTQ